MWSPISGLVTLLAGLLTRLLRLLKCVQYKQEAFAGQNRMITKVGIKWVKAMPCPGCDAKGTRLSFVPAAMVQYIKQQHSLNALSTRRAHV